MVFLLFESYFPNIYRHIWHGVSWLLYLSGLHVWFSNHSVTWMSAMMAFQNPAFKPGICFYQYIFEKKTTISPPRSGWFCLQVLLLKKPTEPDYYLLVKN
jgi:hypothetical protein